VRFHTVQASPKLSLMSSWIVVNGAERAIVGGPESSLLHLLRDELGLTGTKYGCGEGSCGACTVLVDGEAARACQLRAGEVEGRTVTTIEGLARDGRLSPVQRAFAQLGAMQCGYCTPGMVLATTALLTTRPDPSEAEVRTALADNICRCGAYPRILDAVRLAADLARSPDAAPAVEAAALPAFETGPRRPWDLLRPEDRDYFAVLPDGLVVVLPPRPGTETTSGGAWIHVGADGVVTAFTGKVDVGQDSRTTLALLVAEELGVPFEAIRVVMGDTDVCPFDIGTFGSRTMPGAGEDLRAAAAATRRALESTPGGRAGLAGVRRVEVVADGPAPTPPTDWRTAGVPTVRPGAVAMVLGAVRYPSDLTRPGLLHGKVLRPPALGARLRSADLAAAQAMPDVVTVRQDDFVGVAAPDVAAAERAVAAITADWDVDLQPGERSLVEDLRSNPIDVEGWGGAVHHETGDPDAALEAAPVRLAETYVTAYLAHAPLETRAVLAEWRDGRLTVWTGTQAPFRVRGQLAEALDIEASGVRVIVPPTGGGFGGKHVFGPALEAALLASAAGRPVKLTWTREEEFRWGYFRPAAVIDVRSGAAGDGTLTAWEFTNFNAGASAMLTPYAVPHQRIDFQPAASPLPEGAYRALAATANTFARESHMDELAHRVDRDPLELRLAHLEDERLAAVLRAAAERVGWGERSRGGGRGLGIAGGVEKGGRVATCIEVHVEARGRLHVDRIVTAYECGAIVNPDTVRNQVEGATAMALGAALFEAVHFDDGRILNPTFSTYRVPRFTDVPRIEVLLLDRRDIPSAGAGETPMIAVAPALANAIFEATGVRLRSLPLVPSGIVG
jgi:nicotinate dehydrogenase subunit B